MKKKAWPLLILALLLSGCVYRPETAAPAPTASALPVMAPAESTPAPTPSPSPEPTPTPALTPVPTPCPHTAHDPESRRCTLCGELLPHNYVKDTCTLCGGHPEFYEEVLPRELFEPCPRQGRVETLSYTTTAYTPTTSRVPVEIKKELQVYLPYGYDPAEKYDLLILLHGRGGSETTWLQKQEQYAPDSLEEVNTGDLLDNLIAQGRCRKLIVAAPTYYRDSSDPDSYKRQLDQPRFTRELREDILPLLIESCSTWAESGSEEDIIAAREHFGFAGLSMGSIYAYTSIIPDCLDYFSWFGCFSGSDGYMDYLAGLLNSSRFSISYFYNSVGARDPYYYLHTGQYKELVDLCSVLTPGENCAMSVIADVGHEYAAWAAGLANFLSLAFASEA